MVKIRELLEISRKKWFSGIKNWSVKEENRSRQKYIEHCEMAKRSLRTYPLPSKDFLRSLSLEQLQFPSSHV